MPVLRLLLAPDVRATLTAWLKAYGEANKLPGLATGPIEARFHRLREHASAEDMIIWTTPERRAGGAGPQIRIPALQLDLACRFAEGHIWADGVAPMPAGSREPQRERGSVGIALTVGRVELPPEADRPDPLAQEIESVFDRLTGNRWRGFVAPLREALEAEARDDAERAERLAAPYTQVEPRPAMRGQDSPYRLSGLTVSAAAGFDEGEWLDILNERGTSIAMARLLNVDVGGGALDVDVRGADPPSTGTVRPRPRTRIIDQKRAILEELESPRGNLPLLARLMASPAAMPIPRPVYPPQFLNVAVGRNRAQARAVALALGLAEGEALLIEGPPGTGKSTTTGEMIAQILRRDPRARILVCSHSNHGTDNMLMKVVPYVGQVEGLEAARVGMLERVPPDLRSYYVAPDESLADRNVIFTTIDALALSDTAGGSIYDYIVLDEANRATVLDSLVALARGKRFILVGDRLQLQPVLSEAEEQLRLEPALARAGVIGKSLFVWLTERHVPERAVVFLDEQNRMHPVIGGLIARAFYDDRLRNGPAAPRRETGVPHFPTPATWVDTRGLRGLRESRGRGPSIYNLPEARLVTTIARHLLRNAPADMDVGVIAAYAEQAALLRRLLRSEVRTPGRRLEIDTVDAFEGREKDVIVVSLVRSNRRREIGFLQLMQRINVALSRARRLLIVVGDTATLRGSYFDRILRYLRERQAIVPGPRVIAQLRGGVRERGAPAAAGDARQRGRGQRARPDLPRLRGGQPTAPPAPRIAGVEPAAINLDELIAAELAGGTTDRRPQRHRRSPAEILARLNQAIQPAEGASPTDTVRPAAEPGERGETIGTRAERASGSLRDTDATGPDERATAPSDHASAGASAAGANERPRSLPGGESADTPGAAAYERSNNLASGESAGVPGAAATPARYANGARAGSPAHDERSSDVRRPDQDSPAPGDRSLDIGGTVEVPGTDEAASSIDRATGRPRPVADDASPTHDEALASASGGGERLGREGTPPSRRGRSTRSARSGRSASVDGGVHQGAEPAAESASAPDRSTAGRPDRARATERAEAGAKPERPAPDRPGTPRNTERVESEPTRRPIDPEEAARRVAEILARVESQFRASAPAEPGIAPGGAMRATDVGPTSQERPTPEPGLLVREVPPPADAGPVSEPPTRARRAARGASATTRTTTPEASSAEVAAPEASTAQAAKPEASAARVTAVEASTARVTAVEASTAQVAAVEASTAQVAAAETSSSELATVEPGSAPKRGRSRAPARSSTARAAAALADAAAAIGERPNSTDSPPTGDAPASQVSRPAAHAETARSEAALGGEAASSPPADGGHDPARDRTATHSEAAASPGPAKRRARSRPATSVAPGPAAPPESTSSTNGASTGSLVGGVTSGTPDPGDVAGPADRPARRPRPRRAAAPEAPATE